MIDTVILSNVVAKTVGVGLGAEGLNLHAPSDCLKRLGFHYKDFARICSRTLTQMEDLKQLYAAA